MEFGNCQLAHWVEPIKVEGTYGLYHTEKIRFSTSDIICPKKRKRKKETSDLMKTQNSSVITHSKEFDSQLQVWITYLFVLQRIHYIIHHTVGQGLFPNSETLFLEASRLLEDLIVWVTKSFVILLQTTMAILIISKIIRWSS